MGTPTLWQFKCSHFSEKVRWTLDWKGIPHKRFSLYPGWHMLPTLAVSRQRMVPLLRTNGRTLWDSTRIIEYLEAEHPDRSLYPEDPVLRSRAVELEDYFDRLGDNLRRVHYSLLNLHPTESMAFFTGTSSGASYRAYKPLFENVLLGIMSKSMRLRGSLVEKSRALVIEILERFDREVQPNGYLVGDAFSVADLTLASLLSTFVFPAEFPYPLAMPFPDNVLVYRVSLERFSALPWTHEMYRRHRSASAEIE